MNKLSFVIMAGLLTMMAGLTAAVNTSIRAETFEVSDHPTSMQILSLINMYNENNPNNPIICSSGFVFPESHGSSSSSSSSSSGGSTTTTSIVNQIGNAIDEAVAGVPGTATTTTTGGGGGQKHHQHQHNDNNDSVKFTVDPSLEKHTKTPVDFYKPTNSNNNDGEGQQDNNDNGDDDGIDGGNNDGGTGGDSSNSDNGSSDESG